mmetsp:Transcript_31057/g.38381  ORF Transcript_31057/g.38381 Transcript_31057/m.38381 type:complete len:111 (+) Transcript_31057:864-1196(+)
MFGFLLLNVLLLVAVIALLSILQTYMQLNAQNPAWQWRSFYTGASGGLWIAAYFIIYFAKNLTVHDLVSDMSFLVYISVFVCSYVMAAGAISVTASYFFVRSIYSDIRKD